MVTLFDEYQMLNINTARVMLAALDHNFYLFRKAKAMVDDGQRGHRKYSKRSQKYHAELVKEEKTYSCGCVLK